MGRRGMSLVETMVTIVIGVLMLAGTVYLFRQSRGSIESAEEKSSALHYGRMLSEYLKRDLRALYWIKGDAALSVDAREDGIAFTRVARGSSDATDLDRIEYSFDAGSGIVTRESKRDGKIRFGDPMMRFREFKIERGEKRLAYRHNHWIAVRMRLSDPEDSPRSRLFLEDKIHPPPLQTKNGVEWID